MIKEVTGISQTSGECKLFHHLPGVYYILKYSNHHWQVTNITQQSERLFGYTQQEVYAIASTFLQTIILPEDLQMVVDNKKLAFQAEKLFNLEFRIKTSYS